MKAALAVAAEPSRPYADEVDRNWTSFLRDSLPSAHGVLIYSEPEALAETVATYLAAGFALDEPAVVVATRDHWPLFRERLADSGWDPDALERSGLLTVADAETTLAAFSEAGIPSAAGFDEVVGGLVKGVAASFPGRWIRAFGEMVDLLSQRGETEEAFALEELWNGLLAARADFSLLCGYQLSVFDRALQTGTIPVVCRLHSHVQPADDADRLSKAVDEALEEVLGCTDAGNVYDAVADSARETRVPVAQLALMWVSKNRPADADHILASARVRYHGEPLAATG